MTKEEAEAKIKEIIANDSKYNGTKVTVIFKDKKQGK